MELFQRNLPRCVTLKDLRGGSYQPNVDIGVHPVEIYNVNSCRNAALVAMDPLPAPEPEVDPLGELAVDFPRDALGEIIYPNNQILYSNYITDGGWTADHYRNEQFRRDYISNRMYNMIGEHLKAFESMLTDDSFQDTINRFLLERIRQPRDHSAASTSSGQQLHRDTPATSQADQSSTPASGQPDVSYINIRILSFGSGPGSDAIAVMAFLCKYAVNVLGIDVSRLKFHVTLVEREAGWRDAALAAGKSAQETLQSLSQLRLGDNVTWEFLQADRAFEVDEPLTRAILVTGCRLTKVAEEAMQCDWISFSYVLADACEEREAAQKFCKQLINKWSDTGPTQVVNRLCIWPTNKIIHLADKFDLLARPDMLPRNFLLKKSYKAYPTGRRNCVSVTPIALPPSRTHDDQLAAAVAYLTQ